MLKAWLKYFSAFVGVPHRSHVSENEIRFTDDSINNILIETQSSNFLKHSFAEADYPMLKQLVADVRMPLCLVDETIFPRPFDQQMETLRFKSGSQNDIDTDEEWDVEDFVVEDRFEDADELDEPLESDED
ncbi:hypothetical protein FOIG_14639 [Fusarium odoratissimum NRRL 54006]|uniref:Uncharacterized protein n=1 Tax=Fusarium odoratissimum (strain NRRL 54006) TaxID=1089451 RepID=X0J7B6_FUSO5|nr:uncharacterized protein FOIG_14639 [Fusarium odoratissimum NRRL 54006]EXL92195.1 hypothetical protein FOIG_14639 [Fusarium odoratissimum NRRL 54006]